MFGRFLGLDVGNTRLRVCAVHKSVRGEKIGIKESVFPQSSMNNNVQEALLFSSLSKLDLVNYSICTAITTSPISSRVLKFPFKDSSKIKQVYKFELENETVHNPDEKLHSYHLLKRDGFSEVLVSMFEKADMESFLEFLKKSGIDPSFVTFSPVAFSSLNSRLSYERPFLLLDISSDETNFMLFDENGLRRVRSLPASSSMFIGGLEIENIDKGKIQPLITEIVGTTHFFESELRDEIKSVVLTGDVCLVEGVEDILAEYLNKSVSRIFIPELGKEDSPLYAKSYAIALYGAYSDQDSLNLRINEFEFEGKGIDIRKNFLIPSLLIAVFLILTFYRGFSESMISKKEVKLLRNEIKREVKKVFPDAPTVIPDPVSFIETEIAKVRDKLDLVEEVKGGSTPLDVIRDIASAFPDSLNIRVDEVRFESGKQLKIWGRCISYKDIATVEKILSESKRFKDVKRDHVSQSVDNSVKFVMSMVVN